MRYLRGSSRARRAWPSAWSCAATAARRVEGINNNNNNRRRSRGVSYIIKRTARKQRKARRCRAGGACDVSTLAKRERERSTRKQAATMSVVTVATDQVGVSASDRPSCSAAIPTARPPGSLPPRSVHHQITCSAPAWAATFSSCSESFCCGFARWDCWDLEAARK